MHCTVAGAVSAPRCLTTHDVYMPHWLVTIGATQGERIVYGYGQGPILATGHSRSVSRARQMCAATGELSCAAWWASIWAVELRVAHEPEHPPEQNPTEREKYTPRHNEKNVAREISHVLRASAPPAQPEASTTTAPRAEGLPL